MLSVCSVLRARSAYRNVSSVSSVLLSAGLMQAIINVWLLPPSESTHRYKHTDRHLHTTTNPAMSHRPETWLLRTLLERNSGLFSYMFYILSKYSTDALGCMGHCSLHIHQPRQTIQSFDSVSALVGLSSRSLTVLTSCG